MNATKTLLDSTRATPTAGQKPIARAQADTAAAADGYTLAGSDGSIVLRQGRRLVGTYSTVRGSLRALIADARGDIRPNRRPPQPHARND